MIFSSSRLLPPCLALILLALSIDGLACSGRLHIEVQDAGVYALDYTAIVAQQPQLKDCASDELVLLNRGKEVPIRVRDEGNGQFGPGSRIEWVGVALHGPESWYDQYSTVNVYLLGAAAGTHARMHELPPVTMVKPAPLRRKFHFEQENLMLRLSDREMKPGEEPDVWQWVKLTPVDAQPFAYTFDLADVDLHVPGEKDIALTLNFRGVSNVIAVPKTSKPVDHVVEVSLNGKALTTLSWDGRDEMRKELDVARVLLHEKGNIISLRIPKRVAPNDPQNFIVDVAMFNWMEVSYPVRGDLAVSTAPATAAPDAAVEFQYKGADIPQLYDGSGGYRAMTALGGGRFVASGAGANVELYPAVGALLSPALTRAVVDGDLRAARSGYDYLIVAHPRLLESIQPLAQFHREHGHTVDVIDVDDIYDQFNDGIIHPLAIRNLVAWGTQHWQIKPRYLLLVGDASTDIHHDVRNGRLTGASYALRAQPDTAEMLPSAGFGGMRTYAYSTSDPQLPNRNLIPTWQFPTGEGQSASDNDFVTMKADDFHPTLAVGRIPVVEPAEVKAIVDKTIDYLSKPMPGPWRHDVTFISTSEMASFKQESDKIAADLDRQGFATNSVYTNSTDKDNAHYQEARSVLRDDLDAGNLLVHFLGHGGSYIWRVGSMGDLFSLDDVSKLTNAGRYPMVLAMTCFSAPFDNPTDDSIGERFLREANRGAVAVFAASWQNSPNPQYSRTLIEELLQPGKPIGDAIVATKAKITDRGFVEMYNLLGDPALVLARPQGKLEIVRTADRWNPQILVRMPGPDFGGDVYVDWIDTDGKKLVSRHYQARNTQFALTPVDKAVTVSVYVADTRNGSTASGGMSLLETPKPVIPVAKPEPVKTRPTVAPTATLPRDPHDTIARLDFDTAAERPPGRKPARAARASTTGSP